MCVYSVSRYMRSELGREVGKSLLSTPHWNQHKMNLLLTTFLSIHKTIGSREDRQTHHLPTTPG